MLIPKFISSLETKNTQWSVLSSNLLLFLSPSFFKIKLSSKQSRTTLTADAHHITRKCGLRGHGHQLTQGALQLNSYWTWVQKHALLLVDVAPQPWLTQTGCRIVVELGCDLDTDTKHLRWAPPQRFSFNFCVQIFLSILLSWGSVNDSDL